VIQTAFPGDAILTLPFIQELKKIIPESEIDVLCIPSTAEIFNASSYVNDAIVLDKRGEHKGLINFFRFVKKLKHNNYQIVYSPHRSFRSALIALQLSGKKSIGFDNSSLPFAFKKIIAYDYSAHEVERNLNLLEKDYIGSKWKIMPELNVPENSKIKVNTFLSDNNIAKFIVVAPGSVWETKKYPPEYFKEIINHFSSADFQVVLVGGEQDRKFCESLAVSEDENVFVSAGKFSFLETIELLKKSSLLICNDSAPTHLGVCADVPVLTIYCSTSPKFGFYPYNSVSDYISYDNLVCKPCGIHGYHYCPLDHFNCGKLLLAEVVISKAKILLKNSGGSR
jgi:heptosyltransferase-2